MKQTEAMSIVHNALVGYVEDSAGAGSEEAKTLDQAWNKLKETLPDSERFPNGFTSWYETFYEIVTEIAVYLDKWNGHANDSRIVRALSEQGRGGQYELAKAWTDEFELINVGRQWDGEFYEEVEEFFKSKNESNI